MPGRRLGDVMNDWWGLLVQFAYTRSRRELAANAFLLGVYLGRLEGSIRYRALYL
jgi:hypothetical protein